MGRALPYANAGHFLAHLVMLLYPTVVLALEEEMALGYGELLALMTVGNMLFGFVALPAGWLADRWSTIGMILVFFGGTSVACLLTGLATTPFQIAAGLALIGTFASAYHPVGVAWLVRSSRNRGRALGINGIFGSLGVAAASFLAGALSDLWSWRAAFVLPGILAATVGLLMAWNYRRGHLVDPPRAARTPGEERDRTGLKVFALLAVMLICSGITYQAMASAMPKLLEQRLPNIAAGSTLGAGGMVTLVYLIAAAAQLVGGQLADRHRARLVYLAIYACYVPLVVVSAGFFGVPLLLLMSAAVFVNTAAIPVENVLLADYTPPGWHGTVYGAKFVLSFGVASVGVPMVALLYASPGGFGWLLLALGALGTGVMLSLLMLAPARGAGRPGAEEVALAD